MKKKLVCCGMLLILLISCASEGDGKDNPQNTDPFAVAATQDLVVYEINPGSFSSQGNLNGITARLGKLQELGVNTIWLMPIYPVGIANAFGSPYCVKDYFAVNPELGTAADLKVLVSEAHKKNIAVILDWVANHTSWDHPWIAGHPDWYTHDQSGAIVSPPGTNWNDVADLNFSNAEMRLQMIAAMRFWVNESGIDGFRCDAADLVPFDFWQEAISALQESAGRNLILLAEGSRDDHFNAGFQMNFGWDWYNSIKAVFTANGVPQTLYDTNSNEYLSVPDGKRKLRFTTNHDLSNSQTPITVFGSKNAALAASVATIFISGVPMLYCGQEVGVTQPSVYSDGNPIDWNSNPDLYAAYKDLFQFYNNSDAARRGTVTSFANPDVIVFEKKHNSEKLLIIVNCRASAKSVALPASLLGNWKNALNGNPIVLSAPLSLTAYQYLILTKEGIYTRGQ